MEASRPATSYRAAGWVCVGRTAGLPPGSASPVEPKGVWLRGLASGWAETLRRPAVRAPGSYPALGAEDASCWARFEFGRSDLADGHRSRLERLGAAWERHPGAPLPAVFPGSAEQQAAYRFLHNKQVDGDDILQPHREALVERCRQELAVLQDTTTLNYTGLREGTQGLGPGADEQRSGSVRACGGGVHRGSAGVGSERPGDVGAAGSRTGGGTREGESALVPGIRSGPGVGARQPRDAGGGGRGPLRATFTPVEVAGRARDEAGLLVRANASRRRRVQVWDPHLRATMRRTLESQPDFGEDRSGGAGRRAGRQAGAAGADGGDRVAHRASGVAAASDRPQDGPVTAWVVRVLEPSRRPSRSNGCWCRARGGRRRNGPNGSWAGMRPSDRGVLPGAQERSRTDGCGKPTRFQVPGLRERPGGCAAWTATPGTRLTRRPPRCERRLLPPAERSRLRPTFAVGWCCWRAWPAGTPRSEARASNQVARMRAVADDMQAARAPPWR